MTVKKLDVSQEKNSKMEVFCKSNGTPVTVALQQTDACRKWQCQPKLTLSSGNFHCLLEILQARVSFSQQLPYAKESQSYSVARLSPFSTFTAQNIINYSLPLYFIFKVDLNKISTVGTTIQGWNMLAFNSMKRSLSPALSVRCIQNRTYVVLLEPERSLLLSGLWAASLENTTLQLPFPHHQKSLLRCTGLSQNSHILYVTWCFLATSPPRGTSFHQGFLFLCSLTEKP